MSRGKCVPGEVEDFAGVVHATFPRDPLRLATIRHAPILIRRRRNHLLLPNNQLAVVTPTRDQPAPRAWRPPHHIHATLGIVPFLLLVLAHFREEFEMDVKCRVLLNYQLPQPDCRVRPARYNPWIVISNIRNNKYLLSNIFENIFLKRKSRSVSGQMSMA